MRRVQRRALTLLALGALLFCAYLSYCFYSLDSLSFASIRQIVAFAYKEKAPDEKNAERVKNVFGTSISQFLGGLTLLPEDSAGEKNSAISSEKFQQTKTSKTIIAEKTKTQKESKLFFPNPQGFSEAQFSVSEESKEQLSKWRAGFFEEQKMGKMARAKAKALKAEKQQAALLEKRATESEDNPDPNKEKNAVFFSAIAKNTEGEFLAGVRLYQSSLYGVYEAQNATLLASSSQKGELNFSLAPSKQRVILFTALGDSKKEVFFNEVNSATAWKNTIITLEIKNKGGVVRGVVLDRWGKACEGAEVNNFGVSSKEQHNEALKKEAYRFAKSNKEGQFELQDLLVQNPLQLSAWKNGSKTEEAQELSWPWIDEGEVAKIENVRLVLKDSGAESAWWRMQFKDEDSWPLAYIDIFLDPKSNEPVAQSDPEGWVMLGPLEPNIKFQPEIRHIDTGTQILETHLFKENEIYESQYTLKVGSNEPAAVGFFLQTPSGFSVSAGWVAEIPLPNQAAFDEYTARGGQAIVVSPNRQLWLEGLEPRRDISLYYSHPQSDSILLPLGSFTLKPAQRLDIGVIRLKELGDIPVVLQGVLIDSKGALLKNLVVECYSSDKRLLGSAQSDIGGLFRLEALRENTVVDLFVKKDGKLHPLLSGLFIPEEGVETLTLVFNEGATLSFVITDESAFPLEGVSASLLLDGELLFNTTSNSEGEVNFFGLELSKKAYTLKLDKQYFESKSQRLYLEDEDDSPKVLMLYRRSGVLVHLKGPWPEKLNKDEVAPSYSVRAWLAFYQDKKTLQPDSSLGNEYGEELSRGELFFATPVNRPFFIFVGALPAPWCEGLYGPFEPSKEIEISIEQVEPLLLKLDEKEIPPWWNLNVFARVYDSKNRKNDGIQIASRIIEGANAKVPPLYLSHRDYEIQVCAEGHEKRSYSTMYPFLDKDAFMLLKLGKTLLPAEKGGYVNSFVVSDPFPLSLSTDNPHHEQLDYGFSKDWLAHLGGEAYFRASHLGFYPHIQDQEKRTTWRTATVNGEGVLDLGALFGSSGSLYSVAYAQFVVRAPSPMQLILATSSDDGLKVWHQGKELRELGFQGARPLVGESDYARQVVNLQMGDNLFQFKISNSYGSWMLRARFLDPDSLIPIIALPIMSPNFGSYTATQ